MPPNARGTPAKPWRPSITVTGTHTGPLEQSTAGPGAALNPVLYRG